MNDQNCLLLIIMIRMFIMMIGMIIMMIRMFNMMIGMIIITIRMLNIQLSHDIIIHHHHQHYLNFDYDRQLCHYHSSINMFKIHNA